MKANYKLTLVVKMKRFKVQNADMTAFEMKVNSIVRFNRTNKAQ